MNWQGILFLVICIVLAVGMIMARFKIKPEFHWPSSDKPAEKDDHHPKPADPHHPASGGGDHGSHDDGHGGGHKKEGGSTLRNIGIFLVLAAIAFSLVTCANRQPKPGGSGDFRMNLAISSGTLPSSPSVPEGWQRVMAPKSSDSWSEWVDIPVGYTLIFCDMQNDPTCSASDFSNARFDIQCRDLASGESRVGPQGCPTADANRVRAKGDQPLSINYRFEREN